MKYIKETVELKKAGCGVSIPMCKTYVYGVPKDRSGEYKLQGGKLLWGNQS
jgi:hypothetical protein